MLSAANVQDETCETLGLTGVLHRNHWACACENNDRELVWRSVQERDVDARAGAITFSRLLVNDRWVCRTLSIRYP